MAKINLWSTCVSHTCESIIKYRISEGEEKDKWERFHARFVIMNQPDYISSNFSCSLVGVPESWHHPGLRCGF